MSDIRVTVAKKYALPAGTAEAIRELGLIHKTLTIGFAQFASLLAGVKTFDASFAAFPANARLIAPPTLETWTGFDDPAHGTYVLVVGTAAGGSQIATSQSVAAGQTNFPKAMTAGLQGYPMSSQSAATLSVRITGSADLNTATAGAVTVNLFYTVDP
jgi:hypothetical protein